MAVSAGRGRRRPTSRRRCRPAGSPSTSAVELGRRPAAARRPPASRISPTTARTSARLCCAEPLGLGQGGLGLGGVLGQRQPGAVMCSSETVSACPITSCSSWAIRSAPRRGPGRPARPGPRAAASTSSRCRRAEQAARRPLKAVPAIQAPQPGSWRSRAHCPTDDRDGARPTTSAGRGGAAASRPAGQHADAEPADVGGLVVARPPRAAADRRARSERRAAASRGRGAGEHRRRQPPRRQRRAATAQRRRVRWRQHPSDAPSERDRGRVPRVAPSGRHGGEPRCSERRCAGRRARRPRRRCAATDEQRAGGVADAEPRLADRVVTISVSGRTSAIELQRRRPSPPAAGHRRRAGTTGRTASARPPGRRGPRAAAVPSSTPERDERDRAGSDAGGHPHRRARPSGTPYTGAATASSARAGHHDRHQPEHELRPARTTSAGSRRPRTGAAPRARGTSRCAPAA